MQFELKAWKYITISRETMDVMILDSRNVTTIEREYRWRKSRERSIMFLSSVLL